MRMAPFRNSNDHGKVIFIAKMSLKEREKKSKRRVGATVFFEAAPSEPLHWIPSGLLQRSAPRNPTAAVQMDRLRVSVSLSYDSIRWSPLAQITGVSVLTASSDWFCMRDIPISVNSAIPTN